MKILEVEKIIEELDEVAAIKINPDFLNKEQIDVPILKQIDLLLDAVGDKGLKLTAKENLPTKVVKEITLCCPSESNKEILEFTNRYLEDEQVSSQRTRIVSEIGKLVKISKGKMHYGSMATAYRSASSSEKFIYLLWQFKKVNLAYFDRMQEASLVNGISYIMLQLVRDKAKMFREPKVYNAFLLEAFPQLVESVEEEIEPISYFSKNPFDEFESMLKLRLFKNFFVPFGLVEERGVNHKEEYECCKTELLEDFLLPFDELDTNVILDKKQFHLFVQRIKKEKLDVQLFHDFCYIYTHAARFPFKPFKMIAEDLVKEKRLIGTASKVQEAFYSDLAKASEHTVKYFTQLEVKGGGSRGESMKSDFLSFIDGLYAILPNDKPHNIMVAMQSISFFFLDMLSNVYKIDIASKDFYVECQKHFDEETVEDIGAVIFVMSELQKRAKKFKRINTNMETMVKEAIVTFVVAVMSIHTDQMERI